MTTRLAALRGELEDQLGGLGRPSAVRSFSVAGVGVEVRVYGGLLADALLPAFDACPPLGGVEVPSVIHAWDHSATGTRMPAGVSALVRPGHNPRYVDGCNHLLIGEGVCALVTEGVQPTTAFFVVDDASTLPWFHRGSPLSLTLASVLGHRGRPFVHAACAGFPDRGGLLLAGRGGSGKSTTALRCLLAGWEYVGDDYVVLHPDDMSAHALYSTAKLAPLDLAADASLVPRAATLLPDPAHTDKTIANLWPAYRAQMPQSLPIRALVTPHVGSGTQTRWQRATAGRGLLALAPSTLIQLASTSAAQLPPLSRVARSVPSYDLELGSEPGGVVAALGELLEHAAS